MTKREVKTVKRILLVVALVVCAVGFAGPASAVSLDWDLYGIGTVVPAVPPGGDAVEVENLQYFINDYNGVSPNTEPYAHTYTADYGTALPGTLPSPATWGEKVTTNNIVLDLSSLSGSYNYLAAKFADDIAYYWIGGLTGEITLDSPFASGAATNLSHISLFNGTPTQVPEPGALMLLGFGLAGVGTLRRFLKR